MSINQREDAVLVKSITSIRRMMPFMMQKRNESVVFFEQTINIDRTLEFVASKKSPEKISISLFHIIMAAINRMMFLRPKMNRYLIGHRTYQRQKVLLSFAVKPKMQDNIDIRAVKVELEAQDLLEDVAEKIENAIQVGRGPRATISEKEVSLILRMPGPLVSLLLWAQKKLDHLNLLPKSMLKSDPLYASVFVANMASLGLDAPFHHLYEYGGISIFAAFGRAKKIPIVNKQGEIVAENCITFRYSFDERIADGFYCAKSLRILERLIKNPASLEKFDLSKATKIGQETAC